VLLARTVQRYTLNPLARQRRIIAWHPLRALNAITVRVFGADLLTVHVRLDTRGPRQR
jgi:pyridoxine 5'-phosphate synthase PdxJ